MKIKGNISFKSHNCSHLFACFFFLLHVFSCFKLIVEIELLKIGVNWLKYTDS